MKKVLSLFLSIMMLLSIMAGLDFSAYALVSSGSCGENVTYTFTENNDIVVLTISGTGPMKDYSSTSLSPFYNHDEIDYVVIKEGVTTIGDSSFKSCSNIVSVTIPNSVTSIGYSAFDYCVGLKELTIPCSAKISNLSSPFDNCTNIEKITLTKGTGKMQNYGTSSSSSATDTYYAYTPWNESQNKCKEIILEDGINNIGNYAFKNCKSLTSVTIPNSVTSIGESAFEYCTSLTSVTIPNSVTSIGESAFEYCTSLTSVTIPDSVTNIGKDTFYNCRSLTSVTIPDSVIIIGDCAFCDCTSLTSVTIPNSVKYISSGAFLRVNNIVYNGTASGSPWGAKAKNGYVDGYLVYRDSTKKQLLGCSAQAISVTIPDSVTSIGEYAFFDCTSLTSVTIPDSVTSIGEYAFKDCTSLTSVTIGNSVDSIGDCAFENCASLTSVTIPDSVNSIGYKAFYNCSGLEELTIPCSAKIYNSEKTFYNCTNIEKITLTKGTGEMQNYGTSSSSSATDTYYQYTPWYVSRNKCKEIILEDGINNIGSYAFYDCTGLTSITIPDSVTSIGRGAFINCTNLTSVNINSLDSWIKIAFYGASSNPLYYAHNLYLNNELVTNLVIPDSVTKIGDYTFCNCSNLTSIDIPNSVTSIGNSAFYGCTSLTSVTIPDSVNSIDDRVFYNCSGLEELTIPCSTKIYNSENAFYNCTNIEKITLTKGTGEMQNYGTSSSSSATDTYYQYTPWYISRNKCKEIILEDGINNIGSYAFYDCTGLTNIVIPNSITSIGESAFNTLINITLPVSKKIDFSGLDKCSNLQIINLSVGTGEMADWSVDYEDSLWYKHKDTVKDINLEEGIETISESAFFNCSNLGKTNVPSTVTNIGRYAYYGCSNLRRITIESPNCTIPNSPNTIDAFATIYGYSDSTAQKYAQEYGREFVSLGVYACKTHTEVIDKAVAPTCTAKGKTEGKHCSVCNEVLVAQETVEATGHSYDNGIVKTKATCTEAGVKTYTCTVCDATKTESIPKLAHTYKPYTTRATTSKNGSVVTKCTVCGTVKSKSTIYYPKKMTLSATSYTYDGKVKKPSVKVVGSNGKTISSANYTVSYASGRKYVGKYAVKVTFKGKYSGTKTLYFTIKPKATSIKSLSAGSKKFTVKWYKRTTQTTGYQVQYSTSSKFSSPKTVTISKTGTTSKTISKLKAKKKYYVRVRTYKTVNGTKYYSSWSKARYVTTKS